MVEYKENFVNAINYAVHKTKYNYWKLILLGIMGSIYVGLGYIAFIYIISKGQDWGAIESGAHGIEIGGGLLALAAALFPVGLLLIIFLGGSLFTSDNLTSISILTKKAKVSLVVIKWSLTLAGNVLGAFIIASIVRLGAIFGDHELYVLSNLIYHKAELAWWNILFSGLLCNILVAGTVWATLATKHSIAKIFLLYFPIWLFAVAGFQHVVANSIIFAFGWLHGDNPIMQHLGAIEIFNPTTHASLGWGVLDNETFFEAKVGEDYLSLGDWSWKVIVINLLPAMVGNWLSGSVILPLVYFMLSDHYILMRNCKKNGCQIEEDACLTHNENSKEQENCYFENNRVGESIKEFNKHLKTKKETKDKTKTTKFK